MNIYVCSYCEEEFEDYPSNAARRKNDFCSKACFDNFRRHTVTRCCVVCGEEWVAVGALSALARRKTCSLKCETKTQLPGLEKGRGWNFKGGRITTQGYMTIKYTEHPLADKDGYVKRSVLAMERKLNRPLVRGEIVHHIDQNRLNDDPDNLMLFESNSAHVKFHYDRGDSNIQGSPKMASGN